MYRRQDDAANINLMTKEMVPARVRTHAIPPARLSAQVRSIVDLKNTPHRGHG